MSLDLIYIVTKNLVFRRFITDNKLNSLQVMCAVFDLMLPSANLESQQNTWFLKTVFDRKVAEEKRLKSPGAVKACYRGHCGLRVGAFVASMKFLPWCILYWI